MRFLGRPRHLFTRLRGSLLFPVSLLGLVYPSTIGALYGCEAVNVTVFDLVLFAQNNVWSSGQTLATVDPEYFNGGSVNSPLFTYACVTAHHRGGDMQRCSVGRRFRGKVPI